MTKQILPALRAMILFTVLTGLVYPGIVTALCQTLFREQADGSLLQRNGQIIGSALLGQNFSRAEYFHPRPSAAGNDGYDASASSGSNLGPTNKKLFDRVKASAEQFRKDNASYKGPIPSDALTASGSGLDPHISPANAEAQVARVSAARGVTPQDIESVVQSQIEGRDLGFFGEPRVNVLNLNLALDRRFPKR